MTRNSLYMLSASCLMLIFAASVATAQEAERGTAGSAPANAAQQQSATDSAPARTDADETFELNITERRITRRDFQASTSVEAGEESARGLNLRVGVAVGADEINVLLRNVSGRVRFRASLERVLERINARRTTTNPLP